MSASTKKPLQRSLPVLLSGAINDGQQLQCQEWPCTVVDVDGAIVTVAFEVSSEFTLPQVTCPIAESRYVRIPVQEGDQGMVMAASTRLGGVTGLGSGLAPLANPSNLGGLVFVPLGNKAWPTIDANAVVLQAPNGAKILTDDGASEIIVDTGQVQVTQGSTTVTVSGGDVTISAPNNVTITVPLTTINGDLSVNGDTDVSGTLSVGGSAYITGTMQAASAEIAGNCSVGTLTVGGNDFSSHEHTPGSYHVGSNAVTGASGGVV